MFVPKISITGIPLDASSLKISDTTGVSPTDATGYGLAAYLPQNNTIWTKQTEMQYLGTDPVAVAFNPTSDNTEVAATLSYAMRDGVYLVTQYWSKPAEATFIGTEASNIITRTGGSPWTGDLGLLENVYGISGDPDDLESVSVISSLTSTTANLSQAYGVDLEDAFIFYKVQKYVLITNGGVKVLHGNIGDMAITDLASGFQTLID